VSHAAPEPSREDKNALPNSILTPLQRLGAAAEPGSSYASDALRVAARSLSIARAHGISVQA